MSYYREIRIDELTKWLIENGVDGYTETTAEELAQRLLDRFDILTFSNTQA